MYKDIVIVALVTRVNNANRVLHSCPVYRCIDMHIYLYMNYMGCSSPGSTLHGINSLLTITYIKKLPKFPLLDQFPHV